MRIRRTERIEDAEIEVFIEDWLKDDESQEVFEERIVRLMERLPVLDTSEPAEKNRGD